MAGARRTNYNLSVEATTGSQYDIVSFKNRSNGDTFRRIKNKQVVLTSTKRALVDLANFPTKVQIGDVIEVKIIGTVKSGSTTHTVGTSGQGSVEVTTEPNPTGGTSI
jgi:hypothetical protein|tara:strand:+ start:9515 stop:9838 length:324 start_codon:yes stop_codon:yes gene_type:complete